jgi:DMSO/TMAO reductase YedYZ molybdopterin-dependent catalytic subunit
VIEVDGTVIQPFTVAVAELARLPRRELTADFHCVTGWSTVGLQWEGVSFRAFYEALIAPRLLPGGSASHLVFAGVDRYRSVVELADALASDVLIADRLGGEPLTPDHGAPVRLVSPSQYGYMSTKHLCRIDVVDRAPRMKNPVAIRLGPVVVRTPLIKTHPRARVWHEERHPSLPAWFLRPLYRTLIRPIKALSARGTRPAGASDPTRRSLERPPSPGPGRAGRTV